MLVNLERIACWLVICNTVLRVPIPCHSSSTQLWRHGTQPSRTFLQHFQPVCLHGRVAHNAGQGPDAHYPSDESRTNQMIYRVWAKAHIDPFVHEKFVSYYFSGSP